MDGVGGLKSVGAKDLSYKVVFIASSVHSADSRFGFSHTDFTADDHDNKENSKPMFSRAEI